MKAECGAYDHRGTVKCRKAATLVVTEVETGKRLDRCPGHARKYRPFAPRFTVEQAR